MANPQKENGYTAIANEILEQIVKTALLGSEFRILLFFIRKTYGFQKKEDWISLTQFEKGTGLSRPTVVKALKNLVIRKILVKTALLAYKLNKDWESWVVNTALLVKHNDEIGKARLTTIGKHRLTHKRKTTKENKRNIQPILFSFKEKINKNSRLTDEGKRKLKLRFKTFSEKELIEAINKFSSDNWWMEHNANRGIAWFFHSDDRIDQFLNLKVEKSPKVIKV